MSNGASLAVASCIDAPTMSLDLPSAARSEAPRHPPFEPSYGGGGATSLPEEASPPVAASPPASTGSPPSLLHAAITSETESATGRPLTLSRLSASRAERLAAAGDVALHFADEVAV